MRKNLIILLLTTIGFYSCGQNHQTTTVKEVSKVKTVDPITIEENNIQTQNFTYDSYIHTAAVRKTKKKPIWTRVVNKADRTLELTINFPADSIIILPSSNAHFKLLVPPDTMTLDKVSTFSFGLEGVETFVRSNFYQPSQLQRTIKPKEESMFYVILLSHLATSDTGVGRTGLFLKEENLYYKLSIDSLTSKLIPCGRIAFINEAGN